MEILYRYKFSDMVIKKYQKRNGKFCDKNAAEGFASSHLITSASAAFCNDKNTRALDRRGVSLRRARRARRVVASSRSATNSAQRANDARRGLSVLLFIA
jgi:hypothetical protein